MPAAAGSVSFSLGAGMPALYLTRSQSYRTRTHNGAASGGIPPEAGVPICNLHFSNFRFCNTLLCGLCGFAVPGLPPLREAPQFPKANSMKANYFDHRKIDNLLRRRGLVVSPSAFEEPLDAAIRPGGQPRNVREFDLDGFALAGQSGP